MVSLLLLLASLMAAQVSPVSSLPQDPAISPALLRLAIELPAGEPVTAIPAEPSVPTQHALVYDSFRLAQITARAAARAGSPIDSAQPPASLTASRLIIVGLPVMCDGRSFPPEHVELTDKTGALVAELGNTVRGDALVTLLPGVTNPDGAIAATFGRGGLRSGDVIRVTYPGGVCGDRVVVSPPARVLEPRVTGMSRPALAAGTPVPPPVQFEVVIDPYGVPKYARLTNAEPDMAARATQSILRWRFEPASANGVAVPSVFRSTLAFGTPTAPLTGANANAPQPPAPAAPPRPNLQQTELNMERVAIELGSKGDVQGIPLDSDGSTRHGLLFDRFHMGVINARAQVAAGTTPTSANAPPGPGLLPPKFVVVAFPLTCDGATNAPRDITFAGASGPAVRKLGANVAGAELAALLPGVTVPDHAIAASFLNGILTDGTVTITYAGPACPGPTNEASLHLTGGNVPRILERVMNAKLPDDMANEPPIRVYVSFIVDTDGRPRFATALDGPASLHAAAEEAASRWRYDPVRLNGVPTPTSMSVPITFTADGQPVPPGPPGAPGRGGAPTPTAGAQPPLTATSRGGINGGDATHDTQSGDIAGLTVATSKCAVADDEQYGFRTDHAIQVRGDAFTGPAREVKYLNALRGPTGQGIHFRRLGSLQGPDRTILDAYEITYAGLDKPLRIYVDEYHFDDPKAPKGLLCGVAIGLTAK
jgi:hypothetical protein